MAYSELVKSFERIRNYMREFYVYGFKSRDEYGMKRHVVAQPAFNSAPFVVIAPGALHSILITALKSIDIELSLIHI